MWPFLTKSFFTTTYETIYDLYVLETLIGNLQVT